MPKKAKQKMKNAVGKGIGRKTSPSAEGQGYVASGTQGTSKGAASYLKAQTKGKRGSSSTGGRSAGKRGANAMGNIAKSSSEKSSKKSRKAI